MAAFIAKLNDAEAEAAETQTWIQFAVDCGYLKQDEGQVLLQECDHIIGKIVNMISRPRPWIISSS